MAPAGCGRCLRPAEIAAHLTAVTPAGIEAVVATIERILPGVVGLLLFGGPTVYLAQQAWLAYRSRRWPSTIGRIVSSEVHYDPYRLGKTRGVPRVRYEYEVDGRSYTGYRVRFGGWLNSDPMAAGRDVDRYRAGVVSVRFDPRRPHVSTLERRLSRLVWLFLGIGIFFMISIGGALIGWWE